MRNNIYNSFLLCWPEWTIVNLNICSVVYSEPKLFKSFCNSKGIWKHYILLWVRVWVNDYKWFWILLTSLCIGDSESVRVRAICSLDKWQQILTLSLHMPDNIDQAFLSMNYLIFSITPPAGTIIVIPISGEKTEIMQPSKQNVDSKPGSLATESIHWITVLYTDCKVHELMGNSHGM